jgi:hypothetical protein
MSDLDMPVAPAGDDSFVSSAADLFDGPFRRRFKVIGPLPVSGKRVRIQSLSEGELSAYQAVAVGKEGFKPARMEDSNRRLMARCLVDKDGNRLLSDSQAGKLAAWDAADAQYVYNECAAFVGLKRDEIEGIEKNFEGTTAG